MDGERIRGTVQRGQCGCFRPVLLNRVNAIRLRRVQANRTNQDNGKEILQERGETDDGV